MPALQSGLDFVAAEGTFARLPDFSTVPRSASGTATGFDLSKRTKESLFALKFTGYIRVPATDVYRFFVRSDDGSRLWIGDALVVDNDDLHSSRERSGVIALGAGLHPIAVAMFEQSGGFELEVSWSGPGIPKARLPIAALARPR